MRAMVKIAAAMAATTGRIHELCVLLKLQVST